MTDARRRQEAEKERGPLPKGLDRLGGLSRIKVGAGLACFVKLHQAMIDMQRGWTGWRACRASRWVSEGAMSPQRMHLQC